MDKEFEKLKRKALHPSDSILPIFIIDPITTRLIYFIKKKKIDITPNQISALRLFIISPVLLILFLLAPILQRTSLYLISAVLYYISLITDGLDGQLARALNKKSKLGAFYDLIGDRCSIILFLVLIFSVGAYYSNNFLIYGSILIFTLKSFQLMVIGKIFYINQSTTDKEKTEIFSGFSTMDSMGISKVYNFFKKVSKIVKIKRWEGSIAAPERYVLTIILPCILIFFKFNTLVIYFFYILTIAFFIHFLLRVIYLLKDKSRDLSGK